MNNFDRGIWRLLLWGGVGLVLLGVGLLAGINLWLSTDSFSRLINRRPDRILIQWSGARMIVPGRIDISDLRIRGHHPHADWYLEIDRARVRVDLLALRRKVFRTTLARGEGARIRFRRRPPAGADGKRHEALPEIPGVSLESVEEASPEPPRPPGWSIELEGLDLRRVEEAWVNEYRLSGSGAIEGELKIQVRGPTHSEGLSLDWREGRMVVGTEEVARGIDLDAEVAIDGLVPHEVKGVESLRWMTGRVELESEVESLGFLRYYLRHAAGLELSGRATLACDVGVDRGKLTPGSRMHLDVEQLAARLPRFEFDGRGEIEGVVEEQPDSQAPVSELRMSLRDVEASAQGATTPAISGPSVGIVVRVRDPDLTTGFQNPEVILELSELLIPDLRVFNDVIPRGGGVAIKRGEARVRARFDAARTSGEGELRIEGEDVGLEIRGRKLEVGLGLTVPYAGSIEHRRLSIDGTELTFGTNVSADGAASAGTPWARFVVKEGAVNLSPARQEAALPHGWHALTPSDGRLVLSGHVADLGLLNDYLSYGRWLQLQGAIDLEAGIDVRSRSVRPGSHVTMHSDRLAARILDWEIAGRAKVEGRILDAGKKKQSELRFDFGGVEIGRGGRPRFRGPNLELRAWGPDLSGAGRLDGLNVRLDLGESEVLNLATLNEYLPHAAVFSLTSGIGALRGHAELSKHAGSVFLGVTARDVVAQVRGEPVTTNLALDVKMNATDPLSGRFALDGARLRFDGTRWIGREEDSEATSTWWGNIEVVDGDVKLGYPPTVDATVRLGLRDTRPLMHALLPKGKVLEWFEPWLVGRNVEGDARAHLGPEGFQLDAVDIRSEHVRFTGELDIRSPEPGDGSSAIEHLDVRGEFLDPLPIRFVELNRFLPRDGVVGFPSGAGDLRGFVEFEDDRGTAALELDGRDLTLIVRGEAIETNLALDIEMRSDAIASRRFDVSGTELRLDDTHWIGDEEAARRPQWWGEIRLTDGEVVLGHPLTFDATVELGMYDTRPLVHLLAARSKVTHWFHRLLEIKDVEGTARIRQGVDGIRFDHIDVSGRYMKIEGRMEFGDGREYVLLHVQLYNLGAAVEVIDGNREIKFVEARDWYEKRLGGPGVED